MAAHGHFFNKSLPDLLYIPLKIFIVSVLDTMSFLPRKEFLIWLLLYFLIFFFFLLAFLVFCKYGTFYLNRIYLSDFLLYYSLIFL